MTKRAYLLESLRFIARVRHATLRCFVIFVCSRSVGGRLSAQDLAPRAYVITRIHSNALTLTWAYYNGGLNFNGTIPITGATGRHA